MGAERCVCCAQRWASKHLYASTAEGSLRARQAAQGAVEQGKDWTIGPQGGNNKRHGIKCVEEKAKV